MGRLTSYLYFCKCRYSTIARASWTTQFSAIRASWFRNSAFRDHDVRDENGFFKAIGSLDQAGADERVRTSIDASIDFFDTANNYAEGESENIPGQSLKNLNIARKDVLIATKVYSRVGPDGISSGFSQPLCGRCGGQSPRFADRPIDLYQIHGDDSVPCRRDDSRPRHTQRVFVSLRTQLLDIAQA